VIRFYDRALSRMSRRELMRAAWALGAAAVARGIDPVPLRAQAPLAKPSFVANPFSLGVASGDPLPDSVVLWTRLAPRPLDGGGMPMANIEVRWELARDDRFKTIAARGAAIARPELGHTVHVEADSLEPGSEYWYRFTVADVASPVGRTRTAPAAGASVDRLRFAVCGCNDFESGYFTAYRHIAGERFDFVFHSGDYIYESRSYKGVREHAGDEIYTLVDYRNRYAQYKLDPDLAAAHASAPFIVTWDDHEVDNDYAGSADETGTPPEVFLLRRAAAYQAYFEHMPLRRAALPSGAAMRLYRRLHFGNLIDLSVLDTRQFRSDQTCGSRWGSCAELSDPARTMLGAEQERWLFDNIASARASWTVLGQQVPIMMRDRLPFAPEGEGRFATDKWDGYAAARQRLFTHLKETRAPNPVVLSGDIHLHWAADLREDFANAASAIVGVEFTNTSITSGGDGADVHPDWEKFRSTNAHHRYHSARRGYIACTATPRLFTSEFRILDRVSVPDDPVRTAATLVVEAGRPGTIPA
jgi:alkaline phosphatase D